MGKLKEELKKEIMKWIEDEIYPVFAEEIVKHHPDDFLRAANSRWNNDVDIVEEFKIFAPKYVYDLKKAIEFLKKFKKHLPEPRPEYVEYVVDKIAINLIASGFNFDDKCYIYLTKCILSLFDYIYSEETGMEIKTAQTSQSS